MDPRRIFLFLSALLFTTLVATPVLAQAPAPQKPVPPVVTPLFELDLGQIDLVWERGENNAGLQATAVLREPTLRVIRQKEKKKLPPDKPVSGSGEAARKALPLPVAVDAIAVHDAEVLFVDQTVPGGTVLRIHDLQIMVENFSTQRSKSGGLPTLVTGRGRIGKEGNVSLFATINPWTGELDFAGRAQVVDLRLEELAALVNDSVGVRPIDGKFTVFMEFSVQNRRIRGGVKPILVDVELAPADPGFLGEVQAWFTDPVVELLVEPTVEVLSNEVRGEERLATVVPLEGTLSKPNAQIWEAIVGVLENAFIQALSASFESVLPSGG